MLRSTYKLFSHSLQSFKMEGWISIGSLMEILGYENRSTDDQTCISFS